jgi:large subunit ribosomal protein L25
MSERVTIAAVPRTVLGKRVKQLRRRGVLPANIFGKAIESRAIELDAREFARTVKSAGLRAMIELKVEGESSPRFVILRGISRAGGTGEPIHVDFFQIDPEKPITANVPLRLVGEAPAVHDLAGTLLPGLEVVAVRCKPLNIPDTIPVDVSSLTGFESVITVGDITPLPGVEILTDGSVIVATVARPRVRGPRPG